MTQKYAVGIDLGTTFSSLAYVDDEGRLESLRLPDGGYTVASAIYFESPEVVIVGEEALRFAIVAPQRVARRFKRFIGSPEGNFECDGKTYRPEELSARVLKKLLQAAETKLGPIETAVISVPFVFDEKRRQATRDAGLIAGLKNVELVDEPVAAGIAYGHKLFGDHGRWDSKELDDLFVGETIMVYDLGGGTFDVTIMRLQKGGKFEVVATDGDERLGGEDWDDVLVHLLTETIERAGKCDVRSSPEFMQELRLLAVDVKHAFSAGGQVMRKVRVEGQSLDVLTRYGDFKRETQHLTQRTIDTIDSLFELKQMSWHHIDRLLMVGGSSRLKAVQEQVGMLSQKVIDMSLQPDTAVAHGAALYAAHLAGNQKVVVKEVVTVNSHPLGLKVRNPETLKVVNDVLLKANRPTLTEVVREYDVPAGKTELRLFVIVGDQDPEACVDLGEVRIKGIPANAKNASVKVSYQFQKSGFLEVKAEVTHDKGKPIRVNAEIKVEGKMAAEDVQQAQGDLFAGVEVQ